MDPLTAGLNLANGLVNLITKIFDATPEPEKARVATDFAAPIHNCSALLQSAQQKINAALGVIQP